MFKAHKVSVEKVWGPSKNKRYKNDTCRQVGSFTMTVSTFGPRLFGWFVFTHDSILAVRHGRERTLTAAKQKAEGAMKKVLREMAKAV